MKFSATARARSDRTTTPAPGMLSFSDAERRLGKEIDLSTAPHKRLRLAMLSHAGAVSAQERRILPKQPREGVYKQCATCGFKRSCEECLEREILRVNAFISRHSPDLTKPEIAWAAIHELGLDPQYAQMLFSLDASDVSAATAAWSKAEPHTKNTATKVAALVVELYKRRFTPVAVSTKSPHRQLFTGKANKHIKVPDGMIVIPPKEREYLNLLLAGKDAHQIAESMGIGAHSVWNHRRSVLSKFGIDAEHNADDKLREVLDKEFGIKRKI